jgi:lipopolysaccharide transport system ATP-binding protein
MADDWTVKAEGVSKKFSLDLRHSMTYGIRDTLRRLMGQQSPNGQLREGEFWAVKDVDFEMRKGESLGVMGINGSGKSTLLRIFNGVFPPDTGRVTIKGRVGALIAAGAGFAPMLTGRENIHVNGSLLGMSRQEINKNMDEIIAFSELDQFIDMPVKHYSSGMFVRLGFAVAAMSSPDVLLIDEVLAVGDLNFQKKCYDYLHRLKRNGTTIILVSHSGGAIWAICDRAIFLHKGEMTIDGSVENVIRAYDDQNSRSGYAATNAPDTGQDDGTGLQATYGFAKGGTGDVIVNEVTVTDPGGVICTEFGFRKPLYIEMAVEVREPIEQALFRLTVDAVHYKYIAVLDSLEQSLELPLVPPGMYRLTIDVPDQNLRPGAYKLNVAVCKKGFGAHLFYWFGAASFIIKHPSQKFLYADSNAILDLNAEFKMTRI